MATRSVFAAAGLLLAVALSMPALAEPTRSHEQAHRAAHRHSRPKAHVSTHVAKGHRTGHRHPAAADHSGGKQYGKASYYRGGFAGKRRAAVPTNAAASKTLPLGTKARVTNLANGKSAEVEITDRGPYVAHRIIDVTPHVADKLGLKHAGVAPVEVKPLDVPQTDGGKKVTGDAP